MTASQEGLQSGLHADDGGPLVDETTAPSEAQDCTGTSSVAITYFGQDAGQARAIALNLFRRPDVAAMLQTLHSATSGNANGSLFLPGADGRDDLTYGVDAPSASGFQQPGGQSWRGPPLVTTPNLMRVHALAHDSCAHVVLCNGCTPSPSLTRRGLHERCSALTSGICGCQRVACRQS